MLLVAVNRVMLMLTYALTLLSMMHSPGSLSTLIICLLVVIIVYLLWDSLHRVSSLWIMLLLMSVVTLTCLNSRRFRLMFEIEMLNMNQQQQQQQRASYDRTAGPSAGQYNIFFLETNETRRSLDKKKMCAIESAALTNPHASVRVYSPHASLISKDLLRHYANIQNETLRADAILKGTRLARWWLKRSCSSSSSSLNSTRHDLFDAVRVALLWRHGGLFVDMDTLTMRSYEPFLNHDGFSYPEHILRQNATANDSANGLFHLSKNHKFLSVVMSDLERASSFSSSSSSSSSQLFLRSARKYCHVADNESIIIERTESNATTAQSNRTSSCDIKLYPARLFYPYDRANVSELFAERSSLPVDVFMSAFALHTYNFCSSRCDIARGDRSVYEFLASRYCPLTYALFF